ncbi:tRNA:m(4)X modification enzyme TRM13 homolog isoform X1 [Papaver somniferum]|uniref:tRNA:m(4)X modification enzyme TRM13 homolog isoform X1 n=1 Tax=Papaver somniferum TaxID=3469 RepID=UPI000E6FAD52|nr:tRNA:m(4)X modification enzyme TRM13 homolog isoform X1 [Papaver somniferum]
MEKSASSCTFWLPRKNRFCANFRSHDSQFCGNHNPKFEAQRIPCPLDPSHLILGENVEAHIKVCPFFKQAQSLMLQPFYKKGINSGREEDSVLGNVEEVGTLVNGSEDIITSVMKRNAVYKMTVFEFYELIRKIEAVYVLTYSDIRESFKEPEACGIWMNREEVDRNVPFQEKHVLQQVSILGNLEEFGVLENPTMLDGVVSSEYANKRPAVVEFGAGRGYLTQTLADCYGIKKILLVERNSYRLKADRSLRQKESLILERLRIDIEDLDLNAVESLKGIPYLAIGKHLCGPATDLTLRCCLPRQTIGDVHSSDPCNLRGLAIATCCHHLCQYKQYINKSYLSDLGIKKDDFHAITWLTSWAIDADHGSDLSDLVDQGLHLSSIEKKACDGVVSGVEEIVKSMTAIERAILGLKCKAIIDMGRLKWVKQLSGFTSDLVKYVPSSISPENHLLVAKYR